MTKKLFALGSATLVALLTPVAATAGTVVDTGTPTGAADYVLNPNQSLAGYFAIGTATTITGLEGFINGNGGSVTATLYADGTTPSAGTALFSTTFSIGAGESWQGATGLNWAVGAANYWLGFASNDNLGMRDGAPNALPAYAFTVNSQWSRFDGLGVGIRVFDGVNGAIPEPGTWALLVLGFGAIGAGMRAHRRASPTVRYSA